MNTLDELIRDLRKICVIDNESAIRSWGREDIIISGTRIIVLRYPCLNHLGPPCKCRHIIAAHEETLKYLQDKETQEKEFLQQNRIKRLEEAHFESIKNVAFLVEKVDALEVKMRPARVNKDTWHP